MYLDELFSAKNINGCNNHIDSFKNVGLREMLTSSAKSPFLRIYVLEMY